MGILKLSNDFVHIRNKIELKDKPLFSLQRTRRNFFTKRLLRFMARFTRFAVVASRPKTPKEEHDARKNWKIPTQCTQTFASGRDWCIYAYTVYASCNKGVHPVRRTCITVRTGRSYRRKLWGLFLGVSSCSTQRTRPPSLLRAIPLVKSSSN